MCCSHVLSSVSIFGNKKHGNAVLQTIKYRITTSGSIPQRTESRYLHTHLPGSITHSSQKAGAIQVPINQ